MNKSQIKILISTGKLTAVKKPSGYFIDIHNVIFFNICTVSNGSVITKKIYITPNFLLK